MSFFRSLVYGLASSAFVLGLPSSDRVKEGSLVERQGPITTTTELVGDGDPHLNFKNVQITGTLSCGDGGCSKEATQGESIIVGFEASVTPAEWITGGFSVQRETSFSQTDACEAGPGERVCVWQRVQHVAYTVQDIRCNANLGCNVVQGPYVMRSPDTSQTGSYCVRGDACRTQNEFYWEDTAIPI
ncbi:hypothetical protein B9Z65_9167 [Elsinoe australis]|uniref:Uncharacterized protein n=1 Tax=Elsinoe australis TaxID=40998 RepID=A0A2P7Z0P7_9PEZI|nr:hypothetical protein B9Z65_9167 [Elsinoe australis]